MNLVIAIVLGALVGAVGFVPMLKLSTRMRKMMAEKNNVGSVGLLLLSLAVSFLVMILVILVVAKLAKDVLLPFVLALALGLSATAIVYGIKLNRK
ncbi:MAG: hypothetical protein PUD81_06125 [Eggerthellales bacterium]|nr:hypothetical protein [Eggerthellales bacterium]